MGSAGSVPETEICDDSNRQRNPSAIEGIEQQIPVEFKPRKKLGKMRRAQNPQNSLQSALSNSFINNGHGSSIFKRKLAGASLRSVLSNDTVLDLENSAEFEKLRREFENFRLSKQNEMRDMQKREKKLESENKRLRGEVQVLQKTCTRLRNEREWALENETQAIERARAFEDDRNDILNHLRNFQESQNALLQQPANDVVPSAAKQASEHGATDTSSSSPNGGAPHSLSPNHLRVNSNELTLDLLTPTTLSGSASPHPLPLLPTDAAYSVECFKFEASVSAACQVKVTPAAFTSWPGSEKVWHVIDFTIGFFESQLADDVELFMKGWCAKYENSLLANHGLKMSSSIRFISQDVISSLLSTTNICVIFLESKISETDLKSVQTLLKAVDTTGASQLKAILFCFKQTEQGSYNSNMTRLKKLLSKLNCVEDTCNCLFIENYNLMEPLVSLVNESINQFVSTFFLAGVLGNCGCCRDLHGILYQKEAFQFHLELLPQNQQANIDQYMFCMNRHLLKEGPVPPLLIKGNPGCGKSTVFAHFLKKHKTSNP